MATSDLPRGYKPLLESDPKSFRIDGKISVRSIAAAFYQGRIDCIDPSRTAPLRAFLAAESLKRAPAFIFEKLFVDRMRRNHEVSQGWHVCGSDREGRRIWFKLSDGPDNDTELETVFARSLIHRKFQVWKAWFDNKGLHLKAMHAEGKTFTARQFLDINPSGMRKWRKDRSDFNSRSALSEAAVGHFSTWTTREANDLIRSRIFINCFLELTGGRPYDIDAVCRQNDTIFVAEFKRKYPSAANTFGLDMHLTKLADILPDEHPLLHFILEDHAGLNGKHDDPAAHLYDAHDESTCFTWLGIHLRKRFEIEFPERMQTNGLDSGQNGGNRKQVSIPRSAFNVLRNAENVIDSSILSGSREMLPSPHGMVRGTAPSTHR